MNRRQFASTLGAAVAGIVAGRTLLADDKPAKDTSKDHMCAGKNACKGEGGCGTKDHKCAGKNACKGQGGCGTKDHKCAGLNECKGKGGCAVPPMKKAPAATPKAT